MADLHDFGAAEAALAAGFGRRIGVLGPVFRWTIPKAPGGHWEADGRLGSRVKARPITALPVTLKGLRASFKSR